MKNFKQIFLTLITLIMLSCLDNGRKLKLGDGDDVIVNLKVLNSEGITKIEFQANGNSEIVNTEQLRNYNSMSFGFENPGEGIFKVCVYSVKDTICSGHYVEGGYRPKLTCTKDQIEVKYHIGNGF